MAQQSLRTHNSSEMNNSEKGLIVGGFKRQKHSEEQKADDTEDRISVLPDEVLQHILSFLETKDAFMTGILSRRWRYLWTGVPVMEFDDKQLYSNRSLSSFDIAASHFIHFVERVLLLRDASEIKRFRLSCRVFFIASCVHSWISSAIKYKVKELDLCLFVQETFLLPDCVFNSRSLTCLKLDTNCILQLPGHISFPSLKILHLGLLTFQDDQSVERLFSSCPMLEELAILDCEWIELNIVSLCIPSLKSLRIDDLPVFGLNGDASGCEIKISAANLSSFKYYGYLANDIQLSDLPPTVKASLDIRICQLNDQISARVVKLFQNVKNACSLEIFNSTVETLFQANVLDHLPVFQQLRHLELSMEVKERTVGFLTKFLKHLPKLEFLNFAEGFDSCLSLQGDSWTRESAPNLLLSTLKTLDLHNFYGNDIEICFLKSLLKSAPCLEKINLFSSSRPSGKVKEGVDLRNQLENVPRGSKHCVISIF